MSTSTAPSSATNAVLKPSAPVDDKARKVEGIDFNQYASRSISVEELVSGYANMGFQATSVGEAVRIINDMVSCSRQLCATRAFGCGERSSTRASGTLKQFSRI
jgi:deoxyhypusine synthase